MGIQKPNKRGRLKLLAVPVLMALGVLAAIIFGYSRAYTQATESTQLILRDLAVGQRDILHTKLDGELALLRAIAASTAGKSEAERSAAAGQMDAACLNSDFKHIIYVLPDGNTYGADDMSEISKQSCILAALDGDAVKRVKLEEGGEYYMMTAPVETPEGEAAVAGLLEEKVLQELLISHAYGGSAYSYLCDPEGKIVVRSAHKDYLEIHGDAGDGLFEMYNRGIDGSELEGIKADFAAGREGSFYFGLEGSRRYAVYLPVGINDWLIVNVIPSEVIDGQAARATKNDVFQITILLLFAAGGMATIIVRDKRNFREMNAEREKLLFEKERFNFVYSTTSISLWEYDLENRRIIQTERSRRIHGFGDVIENAPESLIEAGFIHPESQEALLRMHAKLRAGEKHVEGVIRIKRPEGGDYWYEYVRYMVVPSEHGGLARAIGMSEDITAQREKELVFEKWRQTIEDLPKSKMALLEYNLTKEECEREEGELVTLFADTPQLSFNVRTDEFCSKAVHGDDKRAYIELLNRERLISSYYEGAREEELDFRIVTGESNYRWMHLNVQLVQYPDSSDIKALLMYTDIDGVKRAALEIKTRGEQDALTGALNCGAFIERARKLFERESGGLHAFLMLDLDNFKKVNEVLGPPVGDKILIDIVANLHIVLRYGDLVGRIGEDEFMIILKNMPEVGAIERRVRQLRELLCRRVEENILLTASVGVSIFPSDAETFEGLYEKAELALHCVKDSGRNAYFLYRDSMREKNRLPIAPEAQKSAKQKRHTMLIVDDVEINRMILQKIFQEDFEILEAAEGDAALEVLRRPGERVDIMLLDLVMPKKDGIEVLREIRGDRKLSTLAVIVTSGAKEIEYELEAIELGAMDFVSKPIEPKLVRIRVAGALQKLENDMLRVQNSYLLLQRDEELRHQKELRHMAEHDSLTGLHNKEAFCRDCERIMTENPNVVYAVLLFDIERFKVINELFGYDEGDRILKYIAECIRRAVLPGEAYCRLGKDEFAVCAPYSQARIDEMGRAAERDMKGYDRPFELKIVFGCYVAELTARMSAEAMLDRAALAQRSVKGDSRRQYAFYDDKLRKELLREQEIIGDMNAALEGEQFEVYFQPQYNHERSSLCGAEALVRWNHPERGMIMPGEFIPIFEKNHFIARLDKYVFERTCRFQREWLDKGKEVLPVSVNLSRADLYNPELCSSVVELIESYGLPPSLMRIEITESAYIDNPQQLIDITKQLQSHGFMIEMDDFGSGFSSLNTLKDVPVDIVKLDMQFLSRSDGNERRTKILKHIISMVHELGLMIIAEGVETREQAEMLLAFGCKQVQGYYYARPMPASDYEKLLGEAEDEKMAGK